MKLLSVLACMLIAFVAGVIYERDHSNEAVDDAVIKALRTEAKRNEEVVNGWAHAVNYLRARLRNGDTPKIPLPGPAGTPPSSGGAAGTTAAGVSVAGELATCRAERQRLIEDGAQTMITCRALQEWAK